MDWASSRALCTLHINSQIALSVVWSKPALECGGVHDHRRRDRTDAHGDARDEQLRESKRSWSSSS